MLKFIRIKLQMGGIMKKFKFWKILISVLLVCVLAFSLIACNPPEEPGDDDQKTTSWLNAKTEALNLILGSAVTKVSGFGDITTKVISLDLAASWTNTPNGASAATENFTFSVKGNIDITGGTDTALMVEVVNNSLTEDKLVFGAYYKDGSDIFLKLKNDAKLTGNIFGSEDYLTGRISFPSVASIVNLFTDDSTTESTIDMSSLDLDVIIAAVAGFCKDPVGAGEPTEGVNPYITANSDGSKTVSITIDLGSVMTMVKTMGGALLGFISPSSDGKTNDYESLSEYFAAAGLYTKVGSEWQPLSNNNLPACTGVEVVLSAKIDASSNLQNLAVEFKNSTAFDFVLGVPSGNTYKELFNFNFAAGSAKLSVDTLNVGTSKDANIASTIDGKITEFGDISSSNALAFSFSGEVKRYDGNYADATDTYEYKFNIDADVIGAVWAGLEYGMKNKVVKGDMTDAQYDAACYELTMEIVDEVIDYLYDNGNGKAKIEYWMGNGTTTNTYFCFDAASINITNRKAAIVLYTTTAEGQKVKSTLNLYDVIEYAATAAFASEDKATTTLDYKVVIFNTLKALTGLWGNVNFVDSDDNGVVEYTEVYKTFVDGLYAIFNPTAGTKASIDVVIDTIFGGKDKMSVSIESFSFGDVQFMTTPSDLEGFTGGVALSTDSFAVSEIQVGAKVEVDSKTFKVLDYLVTQRDASNKITKAKVIAWTCDAEGNVVLNGGCVVFDITGTDITIKDVNGNPIA